MRPMATTEKDVENQSAAAGPRPERHAGGVSGFTCPVCGGVLREHEQSSPPQAANDDDPTVYLCHNGHRFTTETLREAHQHPLQAALWAALRALQQDVELNRRIRDWSRNRGRLAPAELAERRMQEAERSAEQIRRVLEGRT